MQSFRSIFCLTVISYVFSVFNGFSSDINFPGSARNAGMANSAVSVPGTIIASGNPANIARISNTVLGTGFANAYSVSELSSGSLFAIVPVASGSFSANLNYFGTGTYNEQKYSARYAHKLGDKFEAGIACNYFLTKLPPEYGKSYTLSGDIGILAHPLEKLNIGMALLNVSGSSYKNLNNVKLPIIFQGGASWVEKQYILSSQVQIDNRGKTALSFGTEIYIVKNLALRAGVSSEKMMNYTFGLGYQCKKMKFDLAIAHHPILGFSSLLSLAYTLPGNLK